MVRPYLYAKNVILFWYLPIKCILSWWFYFLFFQHLMDSISLRILLLENTVQTSTDWMFVCVSVEVYENKWLCTACVLVQQVSEPWSVQPEEQMPGMSHSVVTLLTAHRLDREKHIPASHPLRVYVYCSTGHQRHLSELLIHLIFFIYQKQNKKLFMDSFSD